MCVMAVAIVLDISIMMTSLWVAFEIEHYRNERNYYHDDDDDHHDDDHHDDDHHHHNHALHTTTAAFERRPHLSTAAKSALHSTRSFATSA
jgi:hypothetical protein